MSIFSKAKAAIEGRDQTMVEAAPATENKREKRAKATCGITAVRQGTAVKCGLELAHSGKHRCADIEWARSGIESLIDGSTA